MQGLITQLEVKLRSSLNSTLRSLFRQLICLALELAQDLHWALWLSRRTTCRDLSVLCGLGMQCVDVA